MMNKIDTGQSRGMQFSIKYALVATAVFAALFFTAIPRYPSAPNISIAEASYQLNANNIESAAYYRDHDFVYLTTKVAIRVQVDQPEKQFRLNDPGAQFALRLQAAGVPYSVAENPPMLWILGLGTGFIAIFAFAIHVITRFRRVRAMNRAKTRDHEAVVTDHQHVRSRLLQPNVIAVALWLSGVILLYICTWPAYEFKIPSDRKVVSISEDGRYLATVVTPEYLVRTFSGRGQSISNHPPRGPIEIWDARGGTVIDSIDCGTDMVGAVHLKDRGNLVVAAFAKGNSGLDTYVSSWIKGTSQPMKKVAPGILLCCADVDGTTVAVVQEGFFSKLFRVIDCRTGKELFHFVANSTEGVILSPDGSRVGARDHLTEDDSRIRVWDTITGDQIGSFIESGYAAPFAFSPDGKTLWSVVKNEKKMEVALYGWDIESQQRHTSITPTNHSPHHVMLMSARNLTFLTESYLEVHGNQFPCLIRVNEGSIDVLDAKANKCVFSADGSLQAAMKYDAVGEQGLTVRRLNDQKELLRLPWDGQIVGMSPDARYLALSKFQTDRLSAVREYLSGLLHTPPQGNPHSARGIYAVDMQDGSPHLVGLLPPHRFKWSPSDGFIDGGNRILVNNYVWKFPGRRPWATILLLPLLVVAVFYGMVKQWRRMLRRRDHG
jgi:WD40 repeat protein